ncbi:glutathione S-transferase family protein [Allokutzneria albata]|uniref:glutathione transferase n=1 Tax=Allokutzneria albata TaxID=211114 RepID=A0A1G9S0S1_ALLAB|nr:glutathione binding-like protein [Allokutzneria albata]SDM29091.1 glutathione S-transferase [Allokutzneria albata]
MKVYGTETSAATHPVLMTFAEKGHEPELVHTSVLGGADKSPENLARQPFGEVPVLDDDGFLLYESRAIIRYLDRRLPGPSLTPADLREYGLMEQWINVEQYYVSGPVWTVVRSGPVYDLIRRSPAIKTMPPAPGDAELAAARGELARAFDAVEKHLEGRTYLAGEQFGLAEICWLPYLTYLFASHGGDLVLERPNLADWWQRTSSRPTWKKVGKVLDELENA